MNNVILKKDSVEVEHLRDQVSIFLVKSGYKSLSAACKETGFDYNLIYGQLNGLRMCRIQTIESFVKSIDKTYGIEFMRSKPFISKY